MAQVIFCTCVLKISNYFIDFSPRNGDFGKCKKNVSRNEGAWRSMLEKHSRYFLRTLYKILREKKIKNSEGHG